MLETASNLPFWAYIAVTLLLTQVTIASVTIFLHRYQAHNALTLHPIASHFFRFWLWLTTGLVTKEWVAVHRKHHAKCETADDPHSPQIQGIWKVLFGGVGLYCAAKRDSRTLEYYGNGTPDDWLERNLYSRYSLLGIAIMAVLDCLVFGAAGLIIFAVQMAWIPFWAAGVVNGLGHFWGYRNFETTDASRNLSPLGIWIGGEELHNNHHAYPHSARLSNKRWEFDIGWLYIKTLALVGLARIRRVAPKVHIALGKRVVDIETLRAVVRDRYHILTLYGRQVIRPVVRAEGRMNQGVKRKPLRQLRKLMTREDILPDAHALAILSEALQHSHALETVYRFKARLKELWTRAASDGAKRVEFLEAWCAEAENSGIQALQDFADLLRGYTLQPA
ncbi:MAG: fatty acid desaturase [Methylococcaceae bacterium]|nr:fatty acid desaturase [Methylococcaceae bacterium]MCI0666948.1 fatty acid desaturase [Methylococcaceae bacterium]MCI0733797.1 fatty acid desaturase [Methylococcaceae bacterium]